MTRKFAVLYLGIALMLPLAAGADAPTPPEGAVPTHKPPPPPVLTPPQKKSHAPSAQAQPKPPEPQPGK
jgi:hypothetical protein